MLVVITPICRAPRFLIAIICLSDHQYTVWLFRVWLRFPRGLRFERAWIASFGMCEDSQRDSSVLRAIELEVD